MSFGPVSDDSEKTSFPWEIQSLSNLNQIFSIEQAMSLKSQDDIPLADDDLEVIINDDESAKYMCNGRSLDSIASSYTNGNSSPQQFLENESPDADEQEEKARLIAQVLELQNTLDDLSQRVDSVKEENLKLRSENQVLGQYIENLMSASSVFQSTTPNNVPKKK